MPGMNGFEVGRLCDFHQNEYKAGLVREITAAVESFEYDLALKHLQRLLAEEPNQASNPRASGQ